MADGRVYFLALVGEGFARTESIEAVFLPAAGLWAAVQSMSLAPPISELALRQHDAAVRALADRCDAVLPARFGQVATRSELEARLAPRAAELRRSLERVRGCVQMTVRCLAVESPSSTPASCEIVNPGRRYLEARRRAEGAIPLRGLRERVAGLIRGERLMAARVGRSSAALHQLAMKPSLARYLEIVEREVRTCADARLSLSGPWPPYALAQAGL